MRKITLLLLLLVSGFVFSQTTKEGKWNEELPADATTEKEYNYLTKGMKIQIESGLDIIDGYSLQKCADKKIGNYNFNVQYLVEKNESKLKAISVIISSYVSGKTYYVCVPIKNEGLTSKYWALISQFDQPMLQGYGYMMSSLFIDRMARSTNGK